MKTRCAAAAVALLLTPAVGRAATYPAPVEGDYVIANFRFGTGEVLPELRIHYRTIGTPRRDQAGVIRNAVLLLHGTSGTGANFLVPDFAGQLFEQGQLLDGNTHFIIIPDAIGTGRSSKPSDGLRAKFPRYDYADSVSAQHMLMTAAFGVTHLRLLLGTSMGAMQAWMWAEAYPAVSDAFVALASNPVAVAGRNRAYRKMIIDAIRTDPGYNNGEYTTQPRGLVTAIYLSMIAGSAALQWQRQYPTGAAVDKYIEDQVKAQLATADANDTAYRYDASRNYDPSPKLESITAPFLAINSADDFVNPPELGLMERAITRVKHGRFVLVPISDQTRGHQTHSLPLVWKNDLAALLAATEPK
ncbi:MAG TPA: alpha/beta fold hydrolase [Vicinamibacterales bacterium]|nr:alpha/beta fold hydrolase [Vicinamibacterales bacterium]